jgi:putative transcription factor
LRCEVCGHKIHTEPVTAIIEGARLTVCIECSKHGKIVAQGEYPSKTQSLTAAKPTLHTPILVQKKKTEVPKVQITQEIIEDYSIKIRQAREKLGLTHEDLGKKINEKSSVIGNLETGKMEPNNVLATKLEHALKIKLLTPVTEEKNTQQTVIKKADREMTLGDLIQFDSKGSGEKTERKPS